jgi:Na+/H+ antiporter NhaC
MFKNYMPTIFFIVLILLTAIPAGLLVAWLTKEELRDGRKWFKAIVTASLAGCIVSLFFKNYVIMLTFAYIAIATAMSLKK